MQKKIKVSVGIPAHNEASTIKQLLQSILRQQEINFILKEIIIISDGSTDTTVEKIQEVKDTRITLINDGQRKGKSARLNEIFRTFSGDMLILSDADIIIKDTELFSKIVSNTNLIKEGIAAPNFSLVSPKNFLEKCLHLSIDVQTDVRKKWNNGRNYLSFRGAFMILYGPFAKTIHMPDHIVNNDAYIYFKAIEEGYNPKYLPDVYAMYKTPSTFKDHLAQSSRFQSSKDELTKYIKISPIEYKLPRRLTYITSLKYLITKPQYFSGYMSILFLTKLMRNKNVNHTWTIATSTKKI